MTRSLAPAGSLVAALVAGCSKKPAEAPADNATPPPAAASTEKVVNVYNWSDYIDASILEKFTAETAIKVNYDVYDGNEILETKLTTGKSGYDVVVPTASFVERATPTTPSVLG